ncbi:MAG: type II secretion system minor pseudopilin GspK [Gammaproteobacteria bacterium]
MNVAPRSRQTGIAVLTAVLVVAIATVLAVNLLWHASVDLRRTETLLLQDQARQYELGGEEFAKFGLADDARDDGGESQVDDSGENWAKPLSVEVEGGKLQGYVLDQQGRFNLNGLLDKEGKAIPEKAKQFERLLTFLDLERPLDPDTARALVEATIDWIDPDDDPYGLSGAEQDRYTSRQPPYRPANFWFTSTSELLAVEGYNREICDALKDHVSALPPQSDGTPWKLNVNTATSLVIASLVDGVDPESLDTLAGPYESVEKFLDVFPSTEQIPAALPLDVRSSWFLLTATATIGTAQSTMYSLLERNRDVVRVRLRTFDAN